MEQTNGDCCKVAENLVLDSASEVSTAYIKSFRCRVCGRHHYRMAIKPIAINTRGTDM